MLANLLRSACNLVTSNHLASTKCLDKVLSSYFLCNTFKIRNSFDVMPTHVRHAHLHHCLPTLPKKSPYKRYKKITDYDPRKVLEIEKPPKQIVKRELECLHCKKIMKPKKNQILCPECNNILKFDDQYDIYYLFGIRTFSVDLPKLRIKLKHLRRYANLRNFASALIRDQEYVWLWGKYIEKGYCMLCSSVSRGEYLLNSYGLELPECYDKLDQTFKDVVRDRQLDISLCNKKEHLTQMYTKCQIDITSLIKNVQAGFDSFSFDAATDALLRIRYLKEHNEKPLLKKLWDIYHAEMELRYQ